MSLRHLVSIIVVNALCLGLLMLPGYITTSHLAVPSQSEEAARHQALIPVEAADHGHSHDDGEDFEQQAGHDHGHDPADHSHQVMIVSHINFENVKLGPEAPVELVADLVLLETNFGIDRPPKHLPRA